MAMIQKKFQLLTLSLCFVCGLSAQYDDPILFVRPEAIAAARDQQLAEARDSIAYLERQAAALRAEMNTQLETLGYERAFIFGPDDRYFQDGMHQHFASAPQSFNLHMERNPLHVAFEENHIALYHTDKALAEWKTLKSQLGKAEVSPLWGNIDFERIRDNYSGLLPAQKVALRDSSLRQQWLGKELKCQLFPVVGGGRNPASFNLIESYRKQFAQQAPAKITKVPSDWILAAYPMPGQFNFYLQEYKPRNGYLALKHAVSVLKVSYPDLNLQIRWSDTSGRQAYTPCAMDYMNRIISFPIPGHFFEPGQLYEMALVATDAQTPKGDTRYCLSDETFFRQVANIKTEPPTVDETVIYQHYFRTSLYNNSFAKFNGLELEMSGDSVVAQLSFNEPLCPYELKKDGEQGALIRIDDKYRLETEYTKAAYSTELAYYLSVPHIEPVDTNQQAPITAALDHTLEAPFVYDLRKGNPYSIGSKVKDLNSPAVISGQYTLPQKPSVLLYLHQDRPGPLITQDHFTGKTPLDLSARDYPAVLIFPGLSAMKQNMTNIKAMLEKRRAERAAYFYQIHTWKQKRSGTPERKSIADWEQQEVAHFAPQLKTLWDTAVEYPLPGKTIELHGTYRLPGVNELTAVFSISLK